MWIKNSRFLYTLYYWVGSCILRLIGLFVKVDPNLILFVSYGGRTYNDSPRVVYEYLKTHPVSPDHRYVWAFSHPEQHPEVTDKIKIDTLRFYLTALQAGYWITNTSVARGMDFKKKQTKNILFEHGLVALKKISFDAPSTGKAFVSRYSEKLDAVFIEGKEEAPILARVWNVALSDIHQTGLPRNDDLLKCTPQELLQLKKKFHLPLDKKVILYAPTFRDGIKNENGSHALPLPMDLAKWEDVLGDRYVLLITAHYEVAQLLSALPNNAFVYNAFGYDQINDLMKISDVMISDYSSVIFDYSILERPIFCFGYDYEEYLCNRGSYVDPNTLFYDGVIQDEDTLLQRIDQMDIQDYSRFTATQIKEKYIASYGNAAQKAVDIIFSDNAEKGR